MNSGLHYEFRTTVVRSLLRKDDFFEIGQLIKNSRLYVLQNFVASKILDDQFLDIKSCSCEEIDSYREIMENFVQKCIVR
jgi:pyruvate formate lyase activating enzyme